MALRRLGETGGKDDPQRERGADLETRRNWKKGVMVGVWAILGVGLLLGCGPRGEDSGRRVTEKAGHQQEAGGGVAKGKGVDGASGSGAARPTKPRWPAPRAISLPKGYGPALDLLDNRASAMTFTRHGLVVRCGEPDFAKYIDGTWKNPWSLGQRLQGERVAYVYRNRAKVYLPTPPSLRGAEEGQGQGADGREPREVRKNGPKAVLAFRINGLRRRQKLAVKVNGRYAKTGIELSEAFQNVRFSFPRSLLRPHENHITLYFRRTEGVRGVKPPSWRNAGYHSMRWVKRLRSGAALAAVGLGDESFELPKEATSTRGFYVAASGGGDEKVTLRLTGGRRVTHHILVPKGAKLLVTHRTRKTGAAEAGQKGDGHHASEKESRPKTDGLWFQVGAQSDSTSEKVLYRATYEGAVSGGGEGEKERAGEAGAGAKWCLVKAPPGHSLTSFTSGPNDGGVRGGEPRKDEKRGGPCVLVSGSTGSGGSGPGREVSVLLDLTTLAGKSLEGQAARLSFEAGGRGAVELTTMKLVAPRTPAVPISKKKVNYVFFWLSDALRRDCVGAYGSKVVQTPNFDALAKRGVLFEKPTIQGNHSKPSHGTILTGTYPPVHGFVTSRSRVRGRLIYGQLKRAGWTTAMYSSNGYISSSWGFGKGLDKYMNFIRSRRPSEAKYLWKRARRYLKRKKEGPLFMYLLTIDPHVTYGPPDEFLAKYWKGRYRGPVPRRATGFFLEKILTGRIRLRRKKDLRRLKALYYGEISYNDHWFGVMMKDLEKMGILDESLIVVSSDHGEQFHEHGSYGHAKNLHEEEIAVPLILWWPGLGKKGVRVAGDVEVMDVYATILDLAGVEPNEGTQSASLVPRIRGGRAEAMHAAFSYHAGTARSVTMGRYKFISVHSKKYALYDMKIDPGEQKPVTKRRPVALRLLRNVFGLHNAYMDRWRKSRWGRASNLTPTFNKDLFGSSSTK